MRVVITEDIISKALNESIDEFILEEGMINEKWGDAIKGVWNGLKNAAAMYMDARTNGQWNKKYGIYVNGNTKSGELFYLNKWLNYYKQKLNNIIYSANNPDRRDDYDLWERDPDTKKETLKRRKYDYIGVDGAIDYAKTYCTFQNFNDYIKAISPERENVKLINTYIFNYITKQARQGNLKAVLNNLNIGTFYSSNEGQQYLKMNRNEQQSQQQKIRQAWIDRSTAQQQNTNTQQSQNQQPVPEANGQFKYNPNTIDYGVGKYSTWKPSKDANGRNILVSPKDPTKAVFY